MKRSKSLIKIIYLSIFIKNFKKNDNLKNYDIVKVSKKKEALASPIAQKKGGISPPNQPKI